jgi:hypothetical protein
MSPATRVRTGEFALVVGRFVSALVSLPKGRRELIGLVGKVLSCTVIAVTDRGESRVLESREITANR